MDSFEEKEESHENFLKSDEIFEDPILNPSKKEESHENFLKSDEIFEDPILNPSKYLRHSSYHLESDMSFADSNCFMGDRTREISEEQRFNLESIRITLLYSFFYNKAFAIQAIAIPLILREPYVDLIAQAEGGAGKTMAYAIGMIAKIKKKLDYTQGLCLGITRELSSQILNNVMEPLCNPLKIVVGTPGIISKLIKCKYLNLSNLETFVIDEADELVNLKGDIGKQTIQIRYEVPETCQILMFSATYPENVMSYCKGICSDKCAKIVLPDIKRLMIPERRQFWMWSYLHSGGKLGILQDIYNYVQSTQSIVFCNTKKAVNSTRDLLGDMGIPCSILHSDLTGSERDDNIKKFRGDIKTNNVFVSRVLITTNILARGVDIPTVGLVVNFELPVKLSNRGALLGPDFEAYAHRIARCGRAGRTGIIINIIENESDRQILSDISNHYNSNPRENMIKEWNPKDIDILQDELKFVNSS